MNTNLIIKEGSCFVIFAFEVGERVHCERARNRVKDAQEQTAQFRERRNPAPFFGFDPSPLKVGNTVGEFIVGAKFPTTRFIEITLWPFGVASVKYEIPLSEGVKLEELVELSVAIEADEKLEIEARKQVKSFVEQIGDAIEDPVEPTITEDYVMFAVRSFKVPEAQAGGGTSSAAAISIDDLLKNHKLTLAQMLRSEKGSLSVQVQTDSTQHTFSWADDLTVVDWGAAFIYGSDNGDVLKLLEFELVQLLEFRYLDELLDQQCDEAAALFLNLERQAHEKSRWKRWVARMRSSAIGQMLVADETEEASQRIAGLTVDAIRNISAATNAINVLGDPTLDTLHSLAAKRFRLRLLSDSVEKKLGLLDNVYQKIETRRHSQKSLFLEIAVVVLIVIELVLALYKH